MVVEKGFHTAETLNASYTYSAMYYKNRLPLQITFFITADINTFQSTAEISILVWSATRTLAGFAKQVNHLGLASYFSSSHVTWLNLTK